MNDMVKIYSDNSYLNRYITLLYLHLLCFYENRVSQLWNNVIVDIDGSYHNIIEFSFCILSRVEIWQMERWYLCR